MVKRWYADFRYGCTDTNDAKCSGRTNSAVVLENTKKLHKLVLADHKLKLHEIAEELKILEGNVFTILHKHLSMRKLCSGCCICSQSIKINTSTIQCICLQLFQHNKKEFLHTYVTIDETQIHHFSLESNWQSAEWTVAGESCPKWPKTQTSAGKVLASIFWDAQSILFIDYLEKSRTINSEYYTALLAHLKEGIAKKWPQMKKKKVFFHQDNEVSQVHCNDSKTTWIALWIASAPTLFSRSGPQRLLTVCRPQKNAPGTEIWLQWRSDIRNWGIF